MATIDKIGRQDIVDKICGLVDSLQKDQNFCLSINGAWGSGKSFVLQMIEEQLSKKQEYIIVKYDAWKNTFYSDPLIAMLYCILDTFENATPDDVSDAITAKRAKKTASEVAKKVGEIIVDSVAENNKIVGFIKKAIDKIKSVIKSYKETALTNNTQTAQYKSYSVFLQQTIEQLNEITTQEFYEGKQTKLIILVDEIDRCLPDEQLKILERLHHLFDIKNCAVIVAMNQVCIAKTVNTIYGIDGYEYLRKFFNFTYKLETSANEYLKNLLDDFIKKFDKLEGEHNDQAYVTNIAFQCLLHSANKVLEKVDNRELSRYYDSLLNVCNNFGWQRLTPYYVFFIVIGLYIRKNISSTFLTEAEIASNQEDANDTQEQFANRPMMNYFDYMDEYLGIDRENLPHDLYGFNHIPTLSWSFNEMVHYSLGKQFKYNELRIFHNQPRVNSQHCQELRQLIILYGGEQERCDK